MKQYAHSLIVVMIAAATFAGTTTTSRLEPARVLDVRQTVTRPIDSTESCNESIVHNAVSDAGSEKREQRPDAHPQLPHEVIVIDPGHGGHDGGAVGPYGVEKDVNLAIAKALRKRLESFGFTVVLTRESDYYVSLDDRSAISRAAGAHLFISVHCNAAENAEASGVETYIAAPQSAPVRQTSCGDSHAIVPPASEALNRQLAAEIQGELITTTAARSRGVKTGRFRVLLNASCPAVLVETGFLTHRGEGRLLTFSEYQYKLGTGIAKGIVGFWQAYLAPGMSISSIPVAEDIGEPDGAASHRFWTAATKLTNQAQEVAVMLREDGGTP